MQSSLLDSIAELRKANEQTPPTAKLPSPRTLWDACVRSCEADVSPDALRMLRAKLAGYATALAISKNQDPATWAVYVERHRMSGVRFIVRDPQGREQDLQLLPADPKDIHDFDPSAVPASPPEPETGDSGVSKRGNTSGARDERSGRFARARTKP